ncbi:MAG: hypothetical protein U9N42_07240, partial [Campylobacterota bacterium]|nr:hypothetical protein [Campylobacterota bacterium]
MSLKYISTDGTVLDFAYKKNIIVLSPSYYWFVEKKIPIKSLGKVKKLAPSVLSGRVESMNSFHILKAKDNGYAFYAYSEDTLDEIIKESGFAECELYFSNQINYNSDIQLSDELCLKNISDSIIEIKSSCDSQTFDHVVNQNGFKSKPFHIKSDGDKLVSKTVSVAVALFVIVVVANLTLSSIRVSELSNEVDNISYGTKSSYAAASLVKKYKKLKKQKQKIIKEFDKKIEDKRV